MKKRLRALICVLLVCQVTSSTCTGHKQRGGDKIQNRGAALGDPLRRQRIESHNPLHNRSAAEIENNHGHHGRNKVRRVNLAEFSFGDSLVQQLADRR